jgi:hypothetical protein
VVEYWDNSRRGITTKATGRRYSHGTRARLVVAESNVVILWDEWRTAQAEVAAVNQRIWREQAQEIEHA